MKYWIGEYIRQARVKKGLTQESLAGSVGRKQSYVSKVESGFCEPGFHEVLRMLHVLGAALPPMIDGLWPDRPPSPAV